MLSNKFNFKAYVFAGAALFIGTQAQAGLIDETWQVQVTYVDGNYSNYAVNDTLSFTVTYDDASLKVTEYSYGVTNTYCTGSASYDAGCTYSYPGFNLFADISAGSVGNSLEDFFDISALLADGGSLYGNDYQADWRYEDSSYGQLSINHNDFGLYSGYEIIGNDKSYYDGSAYLNGYDSTGNYLYSNINFSVLGVSTTPANAQKPSIEVSEPSTLALFGLALFGLAARRKKAVK